MLRVQRHEKPSGPLGRDHRGSVMQPRGGYSGWVIWDIQALCNDTDMLLCFKNPLAYYTYIYINVQYRILMTEANRNVYNHPTRPGYKEKYPEN